MKSAAASEWRFNTPAGRRSPTTRIGTVSRAYVEINALGEVRVGRAAIFLNALNLTNVRQRDDEPLLRPAPGLGGEPITDVWAPLARAHVQSRRATEL